MKESTVAINMFTRIYTDAYGNKARATKVTTAEAAAEVFTLLKGGFVELPVDDATSSHYFVHPETGESVDFLAP
jgi:hypothetical protein